MLGPWEQLHFYAGLQAEWTRQEGFATGRTFNQATQYDANIDRFTKPEAKRITYAALLPEDSDRSARRIRDGIKFRLGVNVAVIVSDTFGRPWRRGLTDVAIGVAGIEAVVDLRGTEDAKGRVLQVTEVCVADELASAAEMVMGKASGVAAAVVRGVNPAWLGEGSVRDQVIRHPSEDLFR